MDNSISTKQAWYLFYNSPDQPGRWELPAPARGLWLHGCPHCGQYQTRETYAGGFWAEFITLNQGPECSGVARCACGKWSVWYG